MKVSFDDLYIVPPHPRYAKGYLKTLMHNKKHLESFVAFQGFENISFSEMSSYLLSLRNSSDPYRAFLVVHEDRVLSHIQWIPAYDPQGVRFTYWIRKDYEGQGIITEVVDLLAEQAFLFYAYLYVQLDIDKANVASKRIAEKLGFTLRDEYKGTKWGYLSTGDMEVWVKGNPYFSNPLYEEVYLDESRNPKKSRYRIAAEKLIVDRFVQATTEHIDQVKEEGELDNHYSPII